MATALRVPLLCEICWDNAGLRPVLDPLLREEDMRWELELRNCDRRSVHVLAADALLLLRARTLYSKELV